MSISGKRLVIVSNRLPIVIHKSNNEWQVLAGSGGLVTAMAPVLRDRGGLWIGWPGTHDHLDLDQPMEIATKNAGYAFKPIMLDQDDIDKYYHGFSNEIIWPLFHDLQSHCNFDPAYWETYLLVNKKFAEVIGANIKSDDYIWVHDYHLMNVAKELHARKIDLKMGFFLHIPFPSLDIFLKLPWRFQILRALLEFDLIGFQTLRDRRNFLHCVRTLIKDVQIVGKGQVVTIHTRDSKIKVGNFPISIDYNNFAQQAGSKAVADNAWYIHENLPERKIILGVDRLDYTKGIPERLKAFENALLRFPELHGKLTLVQIVVPSRENIPEYQSLRAEIEGLVSNINGQYTKSGWVPIHYIFRNLERHELVAYYRTAEIALITPLKDGMNLVAKEFCASSLEEDGVLILSEFAGASAQLQKGALLVNPYDIASVADAIYQAFKMAKEEQRQRMRKLRQSIRRQDIFWWVDSFMQAAFTENLYNFPILEEYVSQIEIGRTR